MATHVKDIPTRNGDGSFHVVVESPRGSQVKLKFDAALNAFTNSRTLPLGFMYPYDWGFVAGTQADDGDPLDAMVMWDVPSAPGTVLPCRALGVVKLEQNGKHGKGRIRNDRLIAVPVKGRRVAELRSVFDLSQGFRAEMEHFFVASAALEEKNPKVLGWEDATVAETMVDAATLGRRRKR